MPGSEHRLVLRPHVHHLFQLKAATAEVRSGPGAARMDSVMRRAAPGLPPVGCWMPVAVPPFPNGRIDVVQSLSGKSPSKKDRKPKPVARSATVVPVA